MTLSQAWTGRPPFADIRNEFVVMRQVMAGVRPSRPKKTCNGADVKMPDVFWSIVESCWDANIAKRPTGSELVDALSCAMFAPPVIPVLKEEAHEAGPIYVRPVDEAVLEARAELQVYPVLHQETPSRVDALANALTEQYRLSGDDTVIHEVIMLRRTTLALRAADSRLRAHSLLGLAGALMERYQRTGYFEIVEEATVVSREALAVAEHGDDQSSRIVAIMSIASVLTARYQRAGGDPIIEEALGLWHSARTQADEPSVRCRCIGGIATALLARFDRVGDFDDFEQAIRLYRDALTLNPLDVDVLYGLAAALIQEYERSDREANARTAISLYRRALDIRLEINDSRLELLHRLPLVLYNRRLGVGSALLDEVIALYEILLALRPEPHPAYYPIAGNLSSMEHARGR
jgi:tetratricopeptide (TPR) repeat protein